MENINNELQYGDGAEYIQNIENKNKKINQDIKTKEQVKCCYHYYETLILFILGFFVFFTWWPVLSSIHENGWIRKYAIMSLVFTIVYMLLGLGLVFGFSFTYDSEERHHNYYW